MRARLSAFALSAFAVACTASAARPAQPAPPPIGDGDSPDGDHPDKRPPPQLKVHFIDVGQGAATLLEFSCAAVLVDTGGEKNASFDSTLRLLEYLEQFFSSRPDLQRTLASLWITHPHIDHTRGIKAVVGGFQVEHVVTNGWNNGSGGPQQAWLHEQAGEGAFVLRTVRQSEVLPGGLTDPVIDPVACVDGDPLLRALWGAVDPAPPAWSAKVAENGNNHSVVLRVDLGRASVLITGDLEAEAIEDLLVLHAETGVLDADVYQVGHHGSHNGTTPEQLEQVSPRLAVIPVGSVEREHPFTAWAHGHPRLTVLKLLEEAVTDDRAARREILAGTGAKKFEVATLGRAVYATGWDGSIVVTLFSDGTPPKVTVRRDASPSPGPGTESQEGN